jgi:hypothetical protein
LGRKIFERYFVSQSGEPRPLLSWPAMGAGRIFWGAPQKSPGPKASDFWGPEAGVKELDGRERGIRLCVSPVSRAPPGSSRPAEFFGARPKKLPPFLAPQKSQKMPFWQAQVQRQSNTGDRGWRFFGSPACGLAVFPHVADLLAAAGRHAAREGEPYPSAAADSADPSASDLPVAADCLQLRKRIAVHRAGGQLQRTLGNADAKLEPRGKEEPGESADNRQKNNRWQQTHQRLSIGHALSLGFSPSTVRSCRL